MTYLLIKWLLKIISDVQALTIFKSLKLLHLYDIFRIKLLCFVYKSINKLIPYCFHDFFLLNSDVRGYFAGQSNRGDVFCNHKNSSRNGLRPIRYMGAKTWNELPEKLKNSTSKFSLKKSQEIYSKLYVELNYLQLGTLEI